MFGSLAKANPARSVVFSPLSIEMALAMTREGALGATATEMDTLLGATLRDDMAAVRGEWAKLRSPSDAASKAPIIAIANRLYGARDLELVPGFVTATRDRYGATIERVDFRGNVDGARESINRWVAGQTRDKIRDLLAPGSLRVDTRLVLVNAIYLKAQWQTQFEAARTKPAPFAIAGGKSRDVPTMHGSVAAQIGSSAGARMIELPYLSAGGAQLSMLVVVPERATLGDIEASYARTGIAPWLAATTRAVEADLSLPKFRVEASFELAERLGELGMASAFSDSAQFGGIARSEAVKLSKVVHRAYVSVDEHGSEAAAATAVVAVPTSVPQVERFAVDRSFLFFIHDSQGRVLFGGRVIDPSS